jgi:hypothetical protein
MSYDFFSRKTVVGRKAHICEHCHKGIDQGERHAYCAGKFEGYFVAYREHEDCFKAWQALNNDLRDNRWDDTHPFLADDDYDDGERDWLHERFPAVAARIWPSKFGAAA